MGYTSVALHNSQLEIILTERHCLSSSPFKARVLLAGGRNSRWVVLVCIIWPYLGYPLFQMSYRVNSITFLDQWEGGAFGSQGLCKLWPCLIWTSTNVAVHMWQRVTKGSTDPQTVYMEQVKLCLCTNVFGGMWLHSFLTIWYSSVRLWIKQSAEKDSEMWPKAQEELSKQDLCCKFHFWPLKWKSRLQLLSYSQAVTTAGRAACLICCGFYTARQPQRCRSRVLSRDLRNFKLNVCTPSITISRRRPWDVLYCNIF